MSADTPGTGADLLRRAAAELRDLATTAQHGHPWCPEYTWSAVRHVQRNCGDQIECRTHGGGHNGDCFSFDMYDGRYVAMMHPPVALALALVLEGLATAIDTTVGDAAADDIFAPELALARAVLREDES